jgi:hypothetical protein
MTSDDRIDALFDRLDHWRHLPTYQIERRADIFFSLYLKGVLEKELEVELQDEIVPEFPLKKGLVGSELKNNLSVKVDYVLFSKDLEVAYFVELKTERRSRSRSQDDYLADARKQRFRRLLKGVVDIGSASKESHKYYWLFRSLAQLGFLSLPAGLDECIHSKNRRGLTALLKAIEVNERNPEIRVVYVQPQPDKPEDVLSRSEHDCRFIGFDCFAAHVEQFQDFVSQRFAKSLRDWTTLAGSLRPEI